jgi:hypothetical protein
MSECTPADQAFAATHSSLYCLSRGQTIGLTVRCPFAAAGGLPTFLTILVDEDRGRVSFWSCRGRGVDAHHREAHLQVHPIQP